jgi:hypothetical protein
MKRYLLLSALVFFHASRVLAAMSSQDIYKEAQLKETVARDLESAVHLYQDFLKQPGTDRAMQASAYLHIGLSKAKLGKMDAAKAAWKKVVQDYSDQQDSYAEALNQLQQLQTLERTEVRVSAPEVRVVYESPPATWILEFPRATFLRNTDRKGGLISTAAGGSIGLTKFVQPDAGIAFEAGSLGSSGPPIKRSIAYFSTLVRVEHPLLSVLTFYGKGGPNLYLFKFSNGPQDETKVAFGVSLEAGLTVGFPRGFAFSFGYLLHGFGQTTPSEDFVKKLSPEDRAASSDVIQNRGLRLLGGPTVSLSFRW